MRRGTADISPRSAEVLRFVVDFKRAHAGDGPTRREIAAGCEIPSTANVQYHLQVLERRGLLRLGERGRIAVVGAVWLPGIAISNEL